MMTATNCSLKHLARFPQLGWRHRQASFGMASDDEHTLSLQKQLVESRKRVRELTEAIKAKTDELHQFTQVPSVGRDNVASLLRKFGASSFESSQQPTLPPQLTTHTANLLLLLELSDFCSDAVVSWAIGQGNPRKRSMPIDQLWDTDARSEIAAGVEWLYILAPLVSLSDAVPKQTLRLSRYVTEYRLFHWLAEQNCSSGVNPANRQLIAEAVRSIPTCLPSNLEEHMRRFFLNEGRATRKWVKRFCGRWGVDPGRRLRPGENLGPKVLEDKESWLQFVVLASSAMWPS